MNPSPTCRVAEHSLLTLSMAVLQNNCLRLLASSYHLTYLRSSRPFGQDLANILEHGRERGQSKSAHAKIGRGGPYTPHLAGRLSYLTLLRKRAR